MLMDQANSILVFTIQLKAVPFKSIENKIIA